MNTMMNLTHLKFFFDAALLKSVSEAAKKNFVTQSTISQGISKLEKSLGFALSTHSRQRFEITEEGRIVFEHAKLIFKSIHDMHDKINDSKGQVSGDFHFVCTNSLGMSFIDGAFKKMQESYPQVNLKIGLGGLHHIRTSLVQGYAEVAIVVYDNSFSQFNKHSLVKGQFRLYKSVNAKKNILEKGILVDDEESTFVSSLLGHGLKVQAELGGWEVVARFTDCGIGAGFFPDYILNHNRYPNIKPCTLETPAFEYEICAIYPKGHKLSRAACAFIDLLMTP